MNLAEFYDERCKPNAKSWEACHWRSRESQLDNFDMLLNIASIRPSDTILDVGCGQGDFYQQTKLKGVTSFTGIDVSPKMIWTCKRRFPAARWEVADLKDVEGQWDWVFASGAFNHVGQDLGESITKMFSLARNGIGLTVLSWYDPTDGSKRADYLQNHDPVRALEVAFSLTRWVNMNHTALDGQFVLFMYKDEFINGAGG